MILASSLRGKASAGFSLLEMIVALSILALTLGALYQATAGATRNIRVDEKYAYGVELARSLLADNGWVPATGKSASGETSGGFSWYVKTNPLNFERRRSQSDTLLHEIEVGVNWIDGGKRREVLLHSVVEGYGQ
jgi:general secretion pathway protein I